ncbi:DsbA family protein [Aureimonas leprariae]|uniref:DsbA family protein n=1 Tax=Plantimonas leprariae TaxID=2615207 RepID=A0A7V7PRZ8_9HYPH|nr:DsbA family protein [Aureimonas leprariae]KAB0681823.1 DsbA family protein [Aureimonas leprariae]
MIHRRVLPAAAALTILFAQGASPVLAMSDAEKADIQKVVREYLIENPEVLVEAMSALETKRAAEEARSQSAALAAVADEVRMTPAGTILGNPNGDVTVVEFFDYNCGYCRHALPDMEALIVSDPKLRFVLKEIPVLGDPSVRASRVSLAFRHVKPDLYGKFHETLLGRKGVADEDSALAVAEDLGVSEAEMRAAMALPEVQGVIDDNNRLSAMLKINGTPSYVVGDEVVPGAVGREALAEKIENVRRCARASC